MKEMLRQVRAQRRVRFFPGNRLQYSYHQTSDGQIFLADPLSYLRALSHEQDLIQQELEAARKAGRA